MAMHKVLLRPGINSQLTPTLNEGGFSSGQLIRFRDGLCQKMGGWVRAAATQFLGFARGMHSWVQINGVPDLGFGTNLKLYVFQAGMFNDVTPLAHTSDPLGADPFATTSASPIVTVTDAAYNPGVGDYVTFSGASAVAGLTIDGNYAVVAVPSGTTYTINAGSNANATTSGGGAAVVAEYEISIGLVSATFLFGYGTGPYGSGAYGTGSASVYITPPRVWFIENWGEDMLATPIGGGLYQWVAASGTSVRAAIVTNAPTINNTMVVGIPQQQVILGGSETGGDQDPLLIRWSDIGDDTVWTADATNQAGSYRLPHGSAIVGAINGPQQVLVWTNEGLWLMQYSGQPFIYSFIHAGHACGLIAPHAAVAAANQVYWMGAGQFYVYTGTVQVVPCTVWDAVFGNINQTQAYKIYCGVNSLFNEVIWFYPSASSDEVDSYAKFNWVENTWDNGTLARTSWEDKEVFSLPLAAGTDGYLWSHETGTDNDGNAMDSYAETGYYDIAEGELYAFVNRMIPDFNTFTGTLTITLYLTDYPGATPWTVGPFTVSPTTTFFTFQGRARQAALLVRSNVVGGNYRFGAIRHNARPDGRR